jgi:hypothetical protein
MSLNEWSIVVFIFSAIYYMTIYYSMFFNPTFGKFFLLGFVWIINSFVTLIYGMQTDQIGFVLLFLLEWGMLILVFVKTGKVLKDVSQ